MESTPTLMGEKEEETEGPFKIPFATRATEMRASEIRELLKLTAKPGIISFAGGLPNPNYFPKDKVSQICQDVVRDHGPIALQYGSTEGYQPLREAISQRLKGFGVDIDPEALLITSGSQQALDLVSKILIEAGDYVIAEAPMYLGAASSFSAFRASSSSRYSRSRRTR